MSGGMTPDEIDAARRQVAMDLAIAEAEEHRAEVLAGDLQVALRKADEAMRRAQVLRSMLEAQGVDDAAPGDEGN